MKNVSNRAFIFPLLNREEASTVIRSAGDLGSDPISTNFAKRTKSIAFVICTKGRWFQIQQNYFIQPPEYNNGGGGFRRYYQELPKTFIDCNVVQRLLNNFKNVCHIPEGELVLLQVQTSHISSVHEGKCLTGQGIHSDGADSAIIVCLDRQNVRGARTAVFNDALGENTVLGPTTLEVGEALFWDDNKAYHYVEPASLMDPAAEGCRTVLIGHYPAIFAVTGTSNPNNTLPISGKHPSFTKLERG